MKKIGLLLFIFCVMSTSFFAMDKSSLWQRGKQKVTTVTKTAAEKVKSFLTHRYTDYAITGFCVSFLGYEAYKFIYDKEYQMKFRLKKLFDYAVIGEGQYGGPPLEVIVPELAPLIPAALALQEGDLNSFNYVVSNLPPSTRELWFTKEITYTWPGGRVDTARNFPAIRFLTGVYLNKDTKDVTDGDIFYVSDLVEGRDIRSAVAEPGFVEELPSDITEVEIKKIEKEKVEEKTPILQQLTAANLRMGVSAFCAGWLATKGAQAYWNYRHVLSVIKKYYGPGFDNLGWISEESNDYDRIVKLAEAFYTGGFDEMMNVFYRKKRYSDFVLDFIRNLTFIEILAELYYKHPPTGQELEQFWELFKEKTNFFWPVIEEEATPVQSA